MRTFFNNLGLVVVLALNFLAETVVVAIAAVAMAVAVVGVLNAAEKHGEPVQVTTINRAEIEEEQDSGDSDLPLVRLANTVDRLTGWSKIPPRRQNKLAYAGGLFCEGLGKAIPQRGFCSSFCHSALRQFGVQIQVVALDNMGQINRDNPAIAFVQGILIGL